MYKSDIILKEVYNRGYRIKKGKIISPSKKELKGHISKSGYKVFSYAYKNKSEQVKVHRLVAYQKYKKKLFGFKIQVRHLDGNRLNNMNDNIRIGNQSDNSMDIPHNKRKEQSIYASSYIRRFTNKEEQKIIKFYNSVKSYKITMGKFNIPKSSLHYILNKNKS